MFGYGFGVMGVGMVLMTLVWVGLIALMVWALVRLFPGHGASRNDHDATAEILGQRYAAGEISEAEYEQALQALGKPHRRQPTLSDTHADTGYPARQPGR